MFIVDKFAGATNLIEEMTIVTEKPCKVPCKKPCDHEKKEDHHEHKTEAEVVE